MHHHLIATGVSIASGLLTSFACVAFALHADATRRRAKAAKL